MAIGAGSNAAALGFGALAVGVIGIGVVALVPPNRPAATPATDQTTLAADQDQAPNQTSSQASDQSQVVAEPQQTASVATDLATGPVPLTVKPPTREEFLMFPDGFATLAGNTSPGVVVDILLGDVALERVVADGAGNFGATLFIAPADVPRVMRLIADPQGEAVPSLETYFVAPAAVAPAAVAVVADPPDVTKSSSQAVTTDPDPVETTIGTQTVAVVAQQQSPLESAGSDLPEPVTPEAVAQASTEDLTAVDTPTSAPGTGTGAGAVLVADAQGVRVLQPVLSDLPPEVMSNVALDTITYDAQGEVMIAGRASGEGFVQVYLDNQPLTTTLISEQGDWRTGLPDVDTGVYTLRIDELSAEGKVVSRIETPFQREEAETVAAVFAEDTADDSFQVAVRTVQPGATLWAIAREQFGSGIMYVEVYAANRDLIRNPDLIYPGQVFRIPNVGQ